MIKYVFFGFVFSLFALSSPVSAQQAPPQATLIADIGIHESTILSNDTNGLLAGFTIVNNGEKAQSDIRFGLDIIKKTDKGQVIVDSFVSDQTLTLAPGESMKQEVRYPAPAFLSGEYEIWVVSKATSGLMLGLGMAGKTTFVGTGTYVEIIPESCSLKVAGDEKVYTLYQGVDISKDEDILFSCTLENHSSTTTIIIPYFDTFRRSMYGEKADVIYPTAEEVSINPNEKKLVSLSIPKATKPQSYDVSIIFKEKANQKIISNKVVAHYVLQGMSATIQNASLDKSSYAKGDSASVRLFWSPSADGFPGSRAGSGTDIPTVMVSVRILDEKGGTCTDPLSKKVLTTESDLTMPILMTAPCVSPQTTISLADESGNILDTRTISSPKEEKLTVEEKTSETPEVKSFLSSKVFLFGGITMLSLLGMVLIFWRVLVSKKNNQASKILKSFFFLAFVVAGLFMGGEVGAVTFKAADWNIAASIGINYMLYTVNTDKVTYAPGETVVLSGSAYASFCTNGTPSNTLTATLNGVSASLINTYQGGRTTLYFSGSIPAPTIPGNYNIELYGCYNAGGYCGSASIPITVVAPLVNGSCGAASGTAASSTPSSNLCSTGTASSVSGSGPWSWSCNGSGSNASCSAPIAAPSLTFSAAPTSIALGDSSTLSWISSNTTSCYGWGGGIDGWKTLNGSQIVSPIANTTYFFECWDDAGLSTGVQSVAVTFFAPVADLKINGSDGPIDLIRGDMRSISWTSTNAAACTASSGDGFAGAKAVPSSSESLAANMTSSHAFTCTGPGGSTSDSVQVNVSCTPTAGSYGACNCPTETKTRTDTMASCLTSIKTTACDSDEKNACRNFNWMEVAP